MVAILGGVAASIVMAAMGDYRTAGEVLGGVLLIATNMAKGKGS